MKVFEDIAQKCQQDSKFGVTKGGAALRTRFNTLISQFRLDECRSMRQSGTVEEYGEREQLLQDIITQMDDWKECIETGKAEKMRKKIGIENSGELLRQIAMDEIDEDYSQSSISDNDGSVTGHKRVRVTEGEDEVLKKSGKRKLTRGDKFANISGALSKAKTMSEESQHEK